MSRKPYSQLSVREREIMDVIYRKGPSSVQEVLDGMKDPPSYSAVRATIGILVEKAHLQRRKEGNRFLYHAAQPAGRVRSSTGGTSRCTRWEPPAGRWPWTGACDAWTADACAS